MTAIERHHPARHRAIFLSDIHLGTRGCQAEMLLDFLRKNESEYLYLVGDIVDGWRLKRWWYWPQAHNDVVQKILRKARKGTNVVYIPGNHDEAARQYCQLTFGDVRVEDEAIHVQPDGKKLLVIHGDQFDGIVRYARCLAILGDWAYTAALRINTAFNWGRRKLGLSCWSLSAYLKHKVKNVVQFIANYEAAVAGEARRTAWSVAHPSRRDPHHRRHPLLQRRRLGRELHRAGRGFRRPAAHRALGRGNRARAVDAALTCPRAWRREYRGCASPSSPTPGDRRSTAWCAPSRRS
jgi:UDP-2,3-diacylglucosamine pyrophosphatase LpxH